TEQLEQGGEQVGAGGGGLEVLDPVLDALGIGVESAEDLLGPGADPDEGEAILGTQPGHDGQGSSTGAFEGRLAASACIHAGGEGDEEDNLPAGGARPTAKEAIPVLDDRAAHHANEEDQEQGAQHGEQSFEELHAPPLLDVAVEQEAERGQLDRLEP